MPYLLNIETNLDNNADYFDTNKSIAKSLTTHFPQIKLLNDMDKLTKASAFQLDIEDDDCQGLINFYEDSICWELSLNQNPQRLFDKVFALIKHLEDLKFLKVIPSRQSCMTEYLEESGRLDRVIDHLNKT
jgi:hypothetical protein